MDRKSKIGICEVHKNALSDVQKRVIKWSQQDEMWVCCSCNRDPVLKAMGSVNKKINKKHKK